MGLESIKYAPTEPLATTASAEVRRAKYSGREVVVKVLQGSAMSATTTRCAEAAMLQHLPPHDNVRKFHISMYYQITCMTLLAIFVPDYNPLTLPDSTRRRAPAAAAGAAGFHMPREHRQLVAAQERCAARIEI